MEPKKEERPKCEWCGKRLAPKYDDICKDCAHPAYSHPWSSESATTKTCKREACTCTAVYPVNWGNQKKEAIRAQFPKKITGYGIQKRGLFCTNACAIEWAHKYVLLSKRVDRALVYKGGHTEQ